MTSTTPSAQDGERVPVDLDERLKEVLLDRSLGQYMSDGDGNYVAVNWGDSPVLDKYVEQIKQAFTDAGWRKASKMELMYQDVLNMQAQMKTELTRLKMTPAPPDTSIYRAATLDAIKKEAGHQPGQEWYDRFKAEADKVQVNNETGDSYHQSRVMQQLYRAAKKAAGIE